LLPGISGRIAEHVRVAILNGDLDGNIGAIPAFAHTLIELAFQTSPTHRIGDAFTRIASRKPVWSTRIRVVWVNAIELVHVYPLMFNHARADGGIAVPLINVIIKGAWLHSPTTAGHSP
jgi:hypothetical protein